MPIFLFYPRKFHFSDIPIQSLPYPSLAIFAQHHPVVVSKKVLVQEPVFLGQGIGADRYGNVIGRLDQSRCSLKCGIVSIAAIAQ